jgi:hypothetical protein
MAGQYRFKDINGNVVAQISSSADGTISFSGSAVDFSNASTITLGEVQMAGTASNALLLDGFDSTAFVFTSSFNTISQSISSQLNTLQTTSDSNVGRLDNLESKSSSVDISISSINTVTESVLSRTSNLETKSSSVDISISNINSFTASNNITSLNSKTGSYATTGSNTFFGTQTFSGSVYIANDLIVQGSSSIQYISASSVSIGTNIVQLNTANPSVRFAGLTIIDSGSVGGSGSFLYDSVQDEFIFVHRGNGTNITSSHFVLGPETYDSLGNETYLTSNIIPKGTGKEHLVDSCIFDNGTTTCIKNNLVGTGTISGTNVYASNVSCSPVGCFTTLCAYEIYTPYISVGGTSIRGNSNRLGIGTMNPLGVLSIGLGSSLSSLATYSSIEPLGIFNMFYTNSGTYPFYLDIAAIGDTMPGGSTGGSNIRFLTHCGIANATPVERMRIDNCGRIGIGTTSACNIISARGSMDLGANGYSYTGPSQYGGVVFPRGQILFSNTNSQNQLYLSSNAYTNASGVFAYRNSEQPALALGLDNGGISFNTAGNGTADATISWNTPLIVDNTGVYMANTNTPINIKPENTPSTAITSLSSASSTYNQRPGVYWLNYGSQIFLGYVKFNWHQGRNWVLALKVFNVHDMTSGSPLWQNNTLVNQSDFALNNGRMAKYGAWNNFPFTRLLYEMGNRIPPIMQWNSQKTSLYSVFSSISVGNGSGVGPDSTDPQLSTNSSTTYSSMTNFLGPNFTDFGGAEQIINYYGLGSFANVSSNSTSAANTGISSGFGLTTEHLGTFSGLQSTGRAGAWIGAPMDEAAAFFNRTSSAGADSGFGLGVAGGNNPRTTTSGIISWALGNSVANFLPAYVWLSVD